MLFALFLYLCRLMEKLTFYSLSSGSSGNCYYLGTSTYGILIDAGIATRSIIKRLKEIHVPLSQIRAIMVTHDHSDHIRSVATLGEKYFIPVYATASTHSGIDRNRCTTEKLGISRRYLEKEQTLRIEDLHITPFAVDHDATDSVGYYVQYGDISICFATDLGHINEIAKSYLTRSNYLILEANYDEVMLAHGPYPAHLQYRIASDKGHLSNRVTANFLCDYYNENMKRVFLCHLSQDNNHPELALKTVKTLLEANSIDTEEQLKIEALKRTSPSCLTILE